MERVAKEAVHDGMATTGTVKWFDPVKGFGFIASSDGGPDILLHENVLRNYGQSSVADGADIDVMMITTERGRQAGEVLRIGADERPNKVALADFAEFDPEELAAVPIEPARVKWFDKIKGFGFANVFGSGTDVFVHIEVLRLAGLADLIPGEAIGLRTVEGKRGLMAAEVVPWETAVSKP